jgi:hypothetical protein
MDSGVPLITVALVTDTVPVTTVAAAPTLVPVASVVAAAALVPVASVVTVTTLVADELVSAVPVPADVVPETAGDVLPLVGAVAAGVAPAHADRTKPASVNAPTNLSVFLYMFSLIPSPHT